MSMAAPYRRAHHDPEVAALAAEVRRLVGQTRQLVDQIDITVVALGDFRTQRRTKMAELAERNRKTAL